MNIMSQLTGLERRLKSLENNRGASLRYCEVTGVDKAGNIRVKLLDGDQMVSQPLRSLHSRTLKDKDQCFPDIGEHVACLFAGQGFESGVILGPMYSDKNKTPDQPIHYDYKQYEDGTVIYYDRKEHKLYADIKGDVEVKVTKNVNITIEGSANIKVAKNVNMEVKGAANIKVAKTVNIEAKESMSLKSQVDIALIAPTIGLMGLLRVTDMDGNPGSGVLHGTYTVKTGSFHVPDSKITTPLVEAKDVKAKDVIAGAVDLRTHKHTGVMPGSATTQKPVGG